MKLSSARTTFWILFLTLLVLEAGSWSVQRFIGRPDRVYHSGYMNGYRYDAYSGFVPLPFPNASDAEPSAHQELAILGGSTAAGVGASDGDKTYFAEIR